jgi:hypothetical protein
VSFIAGEIIWRAAIQVSSPPVREKLFQRFGGLAHPSKQ